MAHTMSQPLRYMPCLCLHVCAAPPPLCPPGLREELPVANISSKLSPNAFKDIPALTRNTSLGRLVVLTGGAPVGTVPGSGKKRCIAMSENKHLALVQDLCFGSVHLKLSRAMDAYVQNAWLC